MAFIELIIDGIRTSIMNNQKLLILKEKNADRYLPILINPAEADAIALTIQKIQWPRPLTQDLLFNLIELMECKVLSALISDLRNDCFYAYLIIKGKKKKYSVDCRPSDAVAVAARAMAPIFTAEEVMNKAAIALDTEDKPLIAKIKCPNCRVEQPYTGIGYSNVCENCGYVFT
jgi:bifunctional DNase/RNase